MGKNSAAELAQHAITDDAEAASIGARVDPKSGKWYDLKDGHYIDAKEADQRLGRTTAQGNADRAGGNVGTSFLDAINPLAQIRAAGQGNWSEALMPDPVNQLTGGNVKIAGPVLDTVASIYGGPAGGAAAGALDAALQPGSNLGKDVVGAGTGLAVGQVGKLAVGGVGKLLGGALGTGTTAGGVDLSGMTPAQVAAIGDASSGTAADTSGANWITDPSQIAAAGSAASGGGGPSSAPLGLTTGDILKLIGSGVTAGTNYAQDAAALAEKAREFNATNALNTQNTAVTEGNDAVSTQNKLNTAPLADKSQYLLNASLSAPPAPFKPRDITQPGGTNNLNMPATGGAADQLAANQAAAAKYTPGAGGVDTSTLQLLLNKLKGSGSAFGQMPTTSSTTG